MPFYYYLDPTMLIVLPALIFAFWAQINVSTTYSKYNKFKTSGGVTGFEAARRILDANGLHNVGIEMIRGELTDHYDPRANVIRLSEAVYSSTSAAAVGVASHEAGHAVQHVHHAATGNQKQILDALIHNKLGNIVRNFH